MKKKLIPSYSISEMAKGVGPERHLMLVVGTDDEEIYNRVKLTPIQFKKVCKLINNAKIGFNLTTTGELFKIEEIDTDD